MATTRPRAGMIVRNPGIHGGEPIVKGTRVSVRSVVIEFERYEGDLAEVARSFTIDVDQVESAMAFYEAHKAEIEEIIERREREANAF